jgi:hypothetical protein
MFKLSDFDVVKYDSILARGLSSGLGKPKGQICIEAAICETLGLEHGDDPKCVARAVRSFKIRLNDSPWTTPTARAWGMHDLGIAQLGSLGVVNDKEFRLSVAKKTIQRIIPALFRELYPNRKEVLDAANVCESAGTRQSALVIRNAAAYAAADVDAAYAAYAAADADATYAAAYAAAADAGYATAAAAAAYATYAAAVAAAAAADAGYAAAAAAAYAAYADAAAYAAYAAAAAAAAVAAAQKNKRTDKYLIMSAELALETLRELKSPGVALL